MDILKIFNTQLLEFIEDLLIIFPKDIDLCASKNAILLLKKVNPKALLINWKYYVTDKYKKQIMAGDIDFFLTKQYNDDMDDIEDKGAALMAIERLRPVFKKIGKENKKKASKYLKNLTKLSELYNLKAAVAPTRAANILSKFF